MMWDGCVLSTSGPKDDSMRTFGAHAVSRSTVFSASWLLRQSMTPELYMSYSQYWPQWGHIKGGHRIPHSNCAAFWALFNSI